MAEQRLRRKRTTAIVRLKAAADLLDVLSTQEVRPTQGVLSRKITSLKTVWDVFDNAHESLFTVVAEDEENAELVVYNGQLKIYEDALERSVEFEGTYGEPVSAPTTLEFQVVDLLQLPWRMSRKSASGS